MKDSAADPYATPDDATAPDRARRAKDTPARALPNKGALARPRASLVDRDPPEGQARRSPPAAPPKPPIPTPQQEGAKRAPWPPPVHHAAPAAPIPIAIPPIVGGAGGRPMPSPSPRSPVVDRSRSESTFKKRTMSAAPRSTMKWTLASCAVIAGVVGWRIEQSYDQTSSAAATPPPAIATAPDAGEMTAPAVASARMDAAAPPPPFTTTPAPSSSAAPSAEIATASDAGAGAAQDNVPMVEISSPLLGTYRLPAQTALALSHEAQREPVQGIAGIAGVPKPSLAGQPPVVGERATTFHVITPPWRVTSPITTPRALPPIARPRAAAPLDAQAVMTLANASASRAKTDATLEPRSSPHRVASPPAPLRAPTTQARPEPSSAALARANDRVEALLRKHAEEETR